MTDGNDDPVEIAAELCHETAKAYLIDDGCGKVWVPKSQVEYDEEDGTFTMPEWLAQAKDLI